MLKNYPKKIKWAVDDRPFFLYPENYKTWHLGTFGNGRGRGHIRRGKILGWRTRVTSPDNGVTGVQKTYYKVQEISGYSPEVSTPFVELYGSIILELEESQLYASPNHCLYAIGGNIHLNYSYNGDAFGGKIFTNWGTNENGYGPGAQDWVDWAGMDFRNAKMNEIDGGIAVFGMKLYWVGASPPFTSDPGYTGGERAGVFASVVDGCNFTGAELSVSAPQGGIPAFNTRTGFRHGVYSFCRNTTIFPDGFKLGIGTSGSGAGSIGGTQLTGSGSSFLTEYTPGDKITIGKSGQFTVGTVTSDTILNITGGTFPGNFSGKELSNTT